jgi:hypothetical protein
VNVAELLNHQVGPDRLCRVDDLPGDATSLIWLALIDQDCDEEQLPECTAPGTARCPKSDDPLCAFCSAPPSHD